MHLYSYKLMFYQIDPWSTKMPLSIHSLSYVGADFDALDFCCQHFWKLHLSGSWLVHDKILVVWEFGMGEALEKFYDVPQQGEGKRFL